MRRITIIIDTVNAAFGGGAHEELLEAARILEDISDLFAEQDKPMTLVDYNGNTCGTVTYE